MKRILILYIILLFNASSFANTLEDVNISADTLSKYLFSTLSSAWEFNPFDNPQFADTSFNTENRQHIKTRLDSEDEIPRGWNGIGWFRRWVNVDSSLIGKVIGISLWQAGALEVYLNGDKLFEIGKVGSNADDYEAGFERGPNTIVFNKPGRNLIAVRYANFDLEYFHNATYPAGFIFSFGEHGKLVESSLRFVRERSVYQLFFVSVPLAIAFVHLFLFLFDRRTKDNIYYVVFLLSFTFFIYVNLQRSFVEDVYYAALFLKLNAFGLLATITTGSLSIYSIIRGVPRWFIWFGVAGITLSVLAFLFTGPVVWYSSYAYIMIISIPTGHTLWKKRKSGLGGEWIIRTGFIFMSVMGFTNMLQSFDIVPPIFGIVGLYTYGVLGFIISMSASLARDFFVVNKNLETQLNTVKELSEKTLEQELQAKEFETTQRILEADNDRKTKELDEARKLQLSMLPQCLNDIPGLDICFDMKTATEVGGDYYDYFISDDGTLNIAVGDATGHGTKAGLMVAIIKSLFNALGAKMMIPDFFARCTAILKKMNLGNLFMSLTIVRIKNKYLIASTAGMPPMLIYKHDKNVVEEYTLKGMPLGAFEGFEYDEVELELDSGDIILLLSDGLPELFNEKKQMFGEERIKELLIRNNDKSPDQIVNLLYEEAEKWRGEKSQDDDMTFVVIKILD